MYDFNGIFLGENLPKNVEKYKVLKNEIFIPLKSYVDFSVIYYIKTSVVALFSVKPMFSVNLMSVEVMYHCTLPVQFSRLVWFLCKGVNDLLYKYACQRQVK